MADDTRTHPPDAPPASADGGTHTFGPPDGTGTGTFAPPGGAFYALTAPSDGVPAALAPQPPPDIPGYEVLALIGVGGMGQVFKARQLAANRVVAVKLILAGELAGTAARERFRAEIETTAKLSHPSIVQLYEAGEASGRAFLVCEFVPGGSLASKLDGTPWEAKRAARLLVPLARAVGYAHAAGVIHRDLKPANILLTTDGQPKVADFGIAKRLDADVTSTGSVMGTPSYMPPEQASSARSVGPTADVYSLGAILYELLTGRPPFKGADFVETLDLVRTREPVPPRELSPRVPRDAETICLKCLQKDPGKRYASADALADDLQRFLDGRPIVARPVGRVERAVRWCRRNPAVAGLLAAVLGVFAAGAAVSAFFALAAEAREQEAKTSASRADERAREANTQRERADGEAKRAGDEAARVRAEQDRTAELLYGARIFQANTAATEYRTDRLVQLLDEMRPKLGEPDRRGWEWHHLNRLARGWDREVPLALTPEEAKNSFIKWTFSADGTRAAVLLQGPPGGMWFAALFDVASGRRLRTLGVHGGTAFMAGTAFGIRVSADLRFGVRSEPSSELLEPSPGIAGPPQELARSVVSLWNLEDDSQRPIFSKLDGASLAFVAPGGRRVIAFLSPAYSWGDSPAPPGLRSRVEVWERKLLRPEYASFPLDEVDRYEVSAVSPDTRAVVLWVRPPDGGGRLELWDVADRPRRRGVFPVAARPLDGIAFSPGGRAVAVPESDGTIGVFDARSGGRLGSWTPPADARQAPDHGEKVWGGRVVRVTDDGRRLAVAGKRGTLLVGEWVGESLVRETTGGNEPPRSGPDGRWRSVVVQARHSPLYQFALTADGRLLCANGTGCREWDVARTEAAAAWPDSATLGNNRASATAATRGGRVLYASGDVTKPREASRSDFRVFDAGIAQPARTFALPGGALSAGITPAGDKFLLNRHLRLPSSLHGTDQWSLHAADLPERDLAGGAGTARLSADGFWALVQVAPRDGSLSVQAYRTSDGRLACEVPCPAGEELLDWWATPAGALVLITHPEVKVGEGVNEPVRLTFRFHALSGGTPCGTWTGPALWPWESLGYAGMGVRLPRPFFSADGRMLGVTHLEDDGAARAWVLDAKTGTPTAEFIAPAGVAVTGESKLPRGAFGPGGRVAVWAGSDVVTWAGPGALPVRLTGHDRGTEVLFSADGRRAFTLDEPEEGDPILRVWSLPDGRELMAVAVKDRLLDRSRNLSDACPLWLEGDRLHLLTTGGIRVFDGTPRKE